jgi:two-component system response regulator HydG
MNATTRTKTNILVVDDQVGMLETFTDILEDKDFNVVTADNGFTAISKTKEQAFDLVFMDIKMPSLNGVQTLRELKKVNPKITVIMMTAYSAEDLIEEALKEGAYAVIYKPFDVDKVIQDIERALDKNLILVVDDRSEDRQTFADVLTDKAYRVTTAKNGYEAIDLVKQDNFDVIFVDVKMPGIDGLETFKQIHKLKPEIPVIMITAYSVEDLLRDAVDKGAYACFYKPLDIEKIIKIVEEVRNNKQC